MGYMEYQHFSIEEREKIQTGIWEKRSIRSIARELCRSPSSVSREIKKNLPPELHLYTPRLAHDRALKKRKCRGRTLQLRNGTIRRYVRAHLKRRWSPEQISGRMKLDLGESVSHEAIYQFIYNQYRPCSADLRSCGEDLRIYLRRRRRRRVPKGMRKCQRVLKPLGISIEKRPEIVNLRQRVGDWEGDSVESKDHRPGLNTVVERKVGLLFMTKLKDKTSAATVEAMSRRFAEVPDRFKLTVTLDNGPENSDHGSITKKTGLTCFSAHPYSSHERGTNENTNGLIRDYFPKKTDFSMIPNEMIRFVESEINSRPRKRLNYRTPLEAWSVALTC
jgi:transposase, IS30 family